MHKSRKIGDMKTGMYAVRQYGRFCSNFALVRSPRIQLDAPRLVRESKQSSTALARTGDIARSLADLFIYLSANHERAARSL